MNPNLQHYIESTSTINFTSLVEKSISRADYVRIKHKSKSRSSVTIREGTTGLSYTIPFNQWSELLNASDGIYCTKDSKEDLFYIELIEYNYNYSLEPNPELYLQTIATGCRLNPYFDNTIRYACVENRFIVNCAVDQLAIRIANAYMDVTSGNELTSGSDLTVGAAIQTKTGGWTRFTKDANDTFTVGEVTTLQTDLVDRKCVTGEMISIRFDITCPTGLPYTTRCQTDPVSGSMFEYSTSSPLESCLTGRVLENTTTDRTFFPINIIGYSSDASVALIGTSKCMGAFDSNTVPENGMKYAVGSLSRALFAKGIPHINLGMGGDSMFRFLSSANGLRLAELDFVSNIISEHITNDAGFTIPKLEATVKQFLQILPANKGIYPCTASPHTTSTSGNWTNDSGDTDQTPTENLTKRKFWFDLIKRLPFFSEPIDIGFAHMYAEGSNTWKAGSTTDGLHESGSSAFMLLSRSGVLNNIEFKKPGYVSEKPDFPYITIFDGVFSTAGAKTLTVSPPTGNYVEFISGNSVDGYTTQIGSFSKTVNEGDKITVRTKYPELITNITWNSKTLIGIFTNLQKLSALFIFNISGNTVEYAPQELQNITTISTFAATVITTSVPKKLPKMLNLINLTTCNFINAWHYGNVPDLTNCVALTSFQAGSNATNGGIVGWDGGSFPITLKTFTIVNSGTGMTSETKNAMLAAFLAASVAGATGMSITFSIGSLATGQGLTDKAALIAAGHIVANC